MPMIRLYKGHDSGNFISGCFERLMKKVEGSWLYKSSSSIDRTSLTYIIEPEAVVVDYYSREHGMDPVCDVSVNAVGTKEGLKSTIEKMRNVGFGLKNITQTVSFP